ncbi:MAG: hypothetical protein A7315_00760 [Candidatus Altiarchaeales archaeon WOR_SM1_79]|nr:MAG: hypothetical protein A7315_00760 [Candidatus Altiarchaeales archaeon WOR_SM1_79]
MKSHLNTSKLPVLSGREVIKALRKVGFSVVGQRGSHIRMKREAIEGVDRTRITIVPDHKEVDRGTLLEIIRQEGLTKEEFIDLL